MIHTASPIIIIGCGRSGSSLLDNILGAHPEIAMFGELRFAVVRTWNAMSDIFQNAAGTRILNYFNETAGMVEQAADSSSLIEKIAEKLEPNPEKRRGRIIRPAIADALYLNRCAHSYWGYKEIFNNGEADWSIYDAVFPKAWWVHIIRNPVEYARSAIWHSHEQLADEAIVKHLQVWTAVFKTNRMRSNTGRYFEVRYEQMIADPKRALTPLLDVIGIGWRESCELAVRRQVGAKSERFEMPKHLPALIASVPELPGIMEGLAYPQTTMSSGRLRLEFEPSSLVQNERGRWRLAGNIWPEEGIAWQFDLGQTHLGPELAAVSDAVDFWTRSPLRMFEDDRPLGPAHALHRAIRDLGRGAYSHWQSRLIFSTSDNSNPNENGRTYSFDLLDSLSS